LTGVATILFCIYMLPIFWMVSYAFQTPQEIVSGKWLPAHVNFDNFNTIFGRAKLGQWFLNSLIVSVSSTIGIVLVSAFAGYALGRMKFPGKRVLFLLTISGFMIPLSAIMIPLFLRLKSMGLVNTYSGLILPGLASPISVFILAQYFKGIDHEYEEAARLDGATEPQILFSIMLPMAIPALITVAILSFTGSWNDFVWPLILAQTEKMYTLPVGLTTLAGSDVNIRYGPVMAANVIASLPAFIMYLVFQRYIILGVTVGDLK
jgi:ABC-type glycerol-3-phosphate transport system permease component